MKLIAVISLFFAPGALGRDCLFKEIMDKIAYYNPGDGSHLTTFSRSKLQKSGKKVGYTQGCCIMSPGPEDKKSELSTVVLEIKDESIHVQYYYPTYDMPDKFDAVITAATRCYKSHVNKKIPAKFVDNGIKWMLNNIKELKEA